MPRVPHKSHQIGFPIYSLAFSSPSSVILGGGGGSSSKSGVKNKLSIYDLNNETIECKLNFDLNKGDDCPMSLSLPFTNKSFLFAGINGSDTSIKNENCRLFELLEGNLKQINAKQTITNDNAEVYQRIASISPSDQIVLVDGKDKESNHTYLHALSYPGLNSLLDKPLTFENVDILDSHFSSDGSVLAVTTAREVTVWKVSQSPFKLTKVQTIGDPLVRKEPGASFRFARFGRGIHSSRLYTVTNSAPPLKKKGARPGYLTAWDTTNEWKVIRTTRLADKPITACDISENGQIFAFASSDLSIGVVSAKTLAPLVRILSAHSFPVTCLSFNPTSTILASGSPDNTLRLIQIPQDLAASDSARAFVQTLLIAILLGLLAVLLQLYQSK